MKKLNLFFLFFSIIAFENAQTTQFQWAVGIGGTDTCNGKSIVVDGSGNVYTTGYFKGTADFDPGVGNYSLTSLGKHDVFISKLDASGNFLWAKKIGGATFDDGYGIAVDALGNIYTTGSFGGTVDFDPNATTYTLTSQGQFDCFISKLDASGNFVWAKQMGGTGSICKGNSIKIDAIGNIHTIGYMNGNIDFDPSPSSYIITSSGVFISKLDPTGNFLWAKNIPTNGSETQNSIDIDALGNVYSTGWFDNIADFDPGLSVYNLSSINGMEAAFISKLDASGNFVWAKQMSGSTAIYAEGCSIAIDGNSNVYTTGFFSGTIDMDPNIGVFNLTTSNVLATFVSKLDASGNFVWAKKFDYGFNQGQALALDISGNVYTTGLFTGGDFDPNAGTYNLNTAGSYDIFISKLDASGNFVWAKRMGGASVDIGFAIAVDAAENVYTTGYYSASGDFDPDAGVVNLPASGMNKIFIQKLGQLPVGIIETTNANNLTLYPNPTTGILTIELEKINENGHFHAEIINSLGQLIREEEIVFKNNKAIIQTDELSNGVYVLKLLDSARSDNPVRVSKRFVIAR